MNEGPNFHKLHEMRNDHRVTERDGDIPDAAKKHMETIEEAHHNFHIADYGSLSEAKADIRRQREVFETGLVIDWTHIREALGPEYSELLDTIEEKTNELQKSKCFQSKRLRKMSNNPRETELQKQLIETLTNDIAEKESELTELETEHPEVFRIRNLLAYREGLFKDGHIAEVPSVDEHLQSIEEAMIEGKPMFLHGPTGTGKTSLAVRAAQSLTGKEPEIVYCNPQTKESNVFGKTGIGIDSKTEKQITQFDPAPLVRAMKEGKIVIFDEFTALPKDMMVMLKGVMHARVGDTRTVPGDGDITIAPGFQMIFTANLKSEKNQERQDIPPEMANEFAQNNIEVKYQSKDESYDIMLARLLERDGTLTMSAYDMEVTLPKFCEAISDIQRAYTEKIGGDLGEKEGLKKLVFNQRTVENILARWRTAGVKGDRPDFVSFLDKQLTIPLTFREYSEKDRILTAKILVRHGLLQTIVPEELGFSSDVFSYNATAGDDVTKNSGKVKTYSLHEIAALDPFGVRTSEAEEDVDALVGEIQPERGPSAESVTEINRRLKTLGSNAEVDESIENGIVHLDITPELKEKLKDWITARATYEAADNGSPSYIWDGLKDYPYTPPTTTSLDVVVLNHGSTTPQDRDTMVSHMDSLGYRPLTLAELIAFGILKPELNKLPDRFFNTYKPHSLGGFSRAPYLGWGGSNRRLDASGASDEWRERDRFLFVRKP